MHNLLNTFIKSAKAGKYVNFLAILVALFFIFSLFYGCANTGFDLKDTESLDANAQNKSQTTLSLKNTDEKLNEESSEESNEALPEDMKENNDETTTSEDDFQETSEDSYSLENDPDLSSTVTGNPSDKKQKEAPSIDIKILEGPVLIEDGSLSYWRIQADVKGFPKPFLKFSRDDSLGSWGSNISQINVIGEDYVELLITASNESGEERVKLVFNREEYFEEEISKKIYSEELVPGNYFIDVSLQEQKVRVFFKDELIKEMICSGGTEEDPTPVGSFKISQKIYYAWLPKYDVGAYYYVRFFNSYLFHSVPFDEEGNIIEEEYEKLGQPASHGCLRLDVPDAQWLYETVPLGVIVEIN